MLLIRRMIEEVNFTLSPQVTEKGIVYPLIPDILKDSSLENTLQFLGDLVANKVLERKLVDKIVLCPTCGGGYVSSKYHCPRCESFDVEQVSFIEHLRCGYIDVKKKFFSGEELICPKCKKKLEPGDSRAIGQSFECSSCGFRFDSPKQVQQCRTCGDEFGFREAQYLPLYEYRLSTEAKEAITKGEFFLSALADTLQKKGFDVKVRGSAPGKSGAKHNFDILAKKGQDVFTFDLTFEAIEENLVSMFAKTFDVKPKRAFLVSMSEPKQEILDMSKSYGIELISSSKASEILDTLSQAMPQAKS